MSDKIVLDGFVLLAVLAGGKSGQLVEFSGKIKGICKIHPVCDLFDFQICFRQQTAAFLQKTVVAVFHKSFIPVIPVPVTAERG